MRTKTDTDRFSGLPIELINHICSFLDMKEVVQASLISKRWRYLWRSLPNLNFHENMWQNEDMQWNPEFDKFVDQVLLLYNGSNMNKLSLSYSAYRRKTLLDRWITSAVKHHVQEVRLEYIHVSPTLLAAQVKTLELVQVYTDISNLASYEERHDLGFPNVENLTLRDCTHKGAPFIISSPRLKYLKVENTVFARRPRCEIKICAPNLITLRLVGYMYVDYSMENLAALAIADIDFYISEIYTRPREVIRGCFNHILIGLANVECLTISTHCFQFFPELAGTLKQLLISFQSLKHLRLTEWPRYGYMCTRVKLFQSFPNLEILVLERSKKILDPNKEGEDWDAQLPFQCFLCHLQAIEIHNFEGFENDLKFLGFLLKNGMVLEKITMIANSPSEEKMKELVNFSKKLQFMSKASSTVSIRLVIKRVGRFTVIFEESSKTMLQLL